jgi:hypothetical protein
MWQGSRLISLTINGRITQPIPLDQHRNYVPSAFTQDDSPAWYPTADSRERNILYLLTHQGRRLEPMVVRKGTCAALSAKPRSPSPTIRYTGRCSPIIRRENRPDKSYLRRSGRPAPLSGPCSQMLLISPLTPFSSTKLYSFSASGDHSISRNVATPNSPPRLQIGNRLGQSGIRRTAQKVQGFHHAIEFSPERTTTDRCPWCVT